MVTALVQVENNEIFTTTRTVAEKFNKRHSEVIRKTEELISQIETDAILRPSNLFDRVEYIDAHNQLRPEYRLNRDGFTLLAMSFTGAKALEWKLKYIAAFNEMESRLRNAPRIDNRLEIAKLIMSASGRKLTAIKTLYADYFFSSPAIGSLEYRSDVNTSYLKWIEEYNITTDWIGDFPTTDIYNAYVRYCIENRLSYMGKKQFYSTLENDFNLTRHQKSDGRRYFSVA